MSLLTNVLKLWRTGQYLLPADSGFMVKHLFANGEPGFAKLDFSGFAGMYQDRARTIPYTAVEQPLGSFTGLNGVTATAPADVNRGVVSARVNLLTKTEQFDDAVWSKSRCSVTSNAAVGPDGLMSAEKVIADAQLNPHFITAIVAQKSGATCRISVYAKAGEWDTVILFGENNTIGGKFDLSLGTYVSNVVGSPIAPTITPVGGGWYLLAMSFVTTADDQGVSIRITPSGGSSGAPGDGVAGLYLWGADCRLATDAHLPYQRVNTPTDYDTAGFPHYLKFNGTNTAYVTPSIDFTGTDKMTVWAGYEKTNDGPTSILLETGSDYTGGGGIGVFASNSSSAVFGVAHSDSGGNRLANVVSAATEVGVVTVRYDLQTGAFTSLRKNAAAWSFASSASGGGMLGNRHLYIGARAGTSFFFNGRLYSLIARGAQSSLSQIEATENLIRQKMRLP